MSKTRSGAPRRVAAGLLAGALTVFGLALAAPAGAVEGVVNDRVAGADRFGTAAAACTEAYEDGTDTVIIATARNFPDALAASGLAGDTDACILLVEVDSVPEATVAAIDALGATNAIIVGGVAAVSQDVVDFLEDEVGIATSRVAGDDRFETATAIANELSGICDIEDGLTAILASGRSSADALSAGPLASAGDGTNPCPILLTEQNELPQTTADAIADLGIENIIVVGGIGVISEAVRDEAGDAAGDADVTVLAGTDRNKTAVAIADFEVDELGWAPTTVCLANSRKVATAEGADFGPDALTGGPLCGLREAPMLLVVDKDNLGDDTEGFLDDHSDTIAELLILGGTAVISDIAETAAVDAAENTENDDDPAPVGDPAVTTDPELVGAAIVSTTTAANATSSNPVGTRVRYTFDEPVTGTAPDGTDFKVYSYNGTAYTGQATTTLISGVVEPGGTTVIVNFPTVDTVAKAADLTVATVVPGAVTDGTGATNPIGDAPIGTARTITGGGAGTTTAPDLVSVGGFRTAFTAGNTIVDFTFDEAATTTNTAGTFTAGYSLINVVTGVGVACSGPIGSSTNATAPSGTTSVGGNGSTVHSVSCPNQFGAASNEAASTTNVARGTIALNTVNDGAGNDNPLQAAEVANSGNSGSPDLVSVTFVPGATSTDNDQVIYAFDEPVSTTLGLVTLFNVYDVSGNETNPTTVTRNPSNAQQVSATFGTTTLDNAVGASVEDGAVTGTTGLAAPNQEDEVGVANTQSGSVTPGSTDGPDLVSVTITPVNDVFGNLSSVNVTYVFDEDTTDAAPTAGNFFIELADGTSSAAVTCQSAAQMGARTEELDNTVTCTDFTTLTAAQERGAVKGTVAAGAVTEETGGTLTNPEGAEATTGGNGTPTS